MKDTQSEKSSSEKSFLAEQELEGTVEEILELAEARTAVYGDIYKSVEDFKKADGGKGAVPHVAHDCNLACRYCFAEEGEYHGRRALMSFEVGKKALDFRFQFKQQGES